MDFIIESESAVQKILILSKDAKVITAIDPTIELTSDQKLSSEQLQQLKAHWGYDNINDPPELVIPLFGRDYINSPQEHDGFMAYTLAVNFATFMDQL